MFLSIKGEDAKHIFLVGIFEDSIKKKIDNILSTMLIRGKSSVSLKSY